MTDFFELPRPNPNPNLEILDMKSEGFQPSNSQPNSLNDPNKIKISPNNEIIGFSEEDDPNTDPVIIKNTLYSNQKQNQEKISELDVDDDKETYHESLAQDSTKKALTIIEESLDKIKKDEATKNLIFQTKKPIVNLHLSKKIQNIIDFGEADLGEVGEWVEKTANCNVNQEEEDKDSDFEDVFDDSKPKIFSENLPKISKEPNEDKNIKDKAKNVEKFGIGKSNTANKKNNNGYMLNNLKDKAKYMLLAQGVATSSQKETKEINEGDKANLMLEEKKTEDVFKKNLEEEKKIVNTNQDGENLEFSNKDWEEISKINLEKLNSSHIRMQSEEDVYYFIFIIFIFLIINFYIFYLLHSCFIFSIK